MQIYYFCIPTYMLLTYMIRNETAQISRKNIPLLNNIHTYTLYMVRTCQEFKHALIVSASSK